MRRDTLAVIYCALPLSIVLFFILFPPSPVLDQLPFMMMSHPLIPASLAPASVSMAMGQMNRLSTLASMANMAQLHAKPPARTPTSVIKVNSEDHQRSGADHQPESMSWHLLSTNTDILSVPRIQDLLIRIRAELTIKFLWLWQKNFSCLVAQVLAH